MTEALAPRLSVITVTRNLLKAERRTQFAQAVASVQSQIFRDVEQVIFDGASDDGTQEMIEELQATWRASPGSLPITYQSAPDSGLYDAMNKAVDLARGTYVLFLNSDDLLPAPETLAEVFAQVGASGPDFIYGSTIRFDEAGDTRHLNRMNLKAVLQRMPFGHNAVLVRRAVFQSLGGHDLSFRLASDYDFVLRMIAADTVGLRVDLPVSRFREGGLSGDDGAVGAEYAAIWRKFLTPFIDLSGYSDAEMAAWYVAGVMPLRVSRAVLRANGVSAALRAAARHSYFRSLKRRLQPWRKPKVST